MVRLSAFAVLLLCLVVPTTTPWAQTAKEVEINFSMRSHSLQPTGRRLRAWGARRPSLVGAGQRGDR